jgi:hypothetical protein
MVPHLQQHIFPIIEINKNTFLKSNNCISINNLYIKFKIYGNEIILFYTAIKMKLIDYEKYINLNNNIIIINKEIKNYNINLISLFITSEYCNKFIKNKIQNKEIPKNYLNYNMHLNYVINNIYNFELFSKINEKYNIKIIPKIFYKCLCYKCRKYIKKECLLFF